MKEMARLKSTHSGSSTFLRPSRTSAQFSHSRNSLDTPLSHRCTKMLDVGCYAMEARAFSPGLRPKLGMVPAKPIMSKK